MSRERPDQAVPDFNPSPQRASVPPLANSPPLEKSVGAQDPKIWIAQFTSLNLRANTVAGQITALQAAVLALQNPTVVTLPVYTVAFLPSAASNPHSFAAVTDSVSGMIAIGTVVAGGGTNKVPVYSDGTNWYIV